MAIRKNTLTLAVSGIIAACAVPSYADKVIEEILVTAQKRAESIQEVPISISAFSADALQNLNAQSIEDLGAFTPNLETNNENVTQPSYTIRGLSTNNFGSGNDPAAAVYIDGVYTARSGGALVNFLDVERVEVLLGPQGTLFGRNATTGAISITTKKPHAETEAKIKLTGGSYGQRNFDGVYNTALSDNIYARVSAGIQKNDGIYKNASGGTDFESQDSQTYSASVLFDASESTEYILSATYNKLDQGNSPGSSENPAANPLGYNDPFSDHYADTDIFEKRELFGSALTINHDINDELTFKSITAYRTFNAMNREDEDGSDSTWFKAETDNIEKQEQISQEIQFNYTGEKIKWTAGANYFKEEIEQDHVIGLNYNTLEQFALTQVLASAEFAPVMAGLNLTPDQTSAHQLITGTGAGPLLNAGWGMFSAGLCPTLDAAYSLGGATCTPGAGYSLGSGLATFVAGNPQVFGLSTSAAITPLIGHPALAGLVPIDTSSWNEVTHNQGKNESFAVFGDFTYSATDKLDVTLGARYTVDEKDYAVSTQYQNFLLQPLLGPFAPAAGLAFFEPGTVSKSEKWESLTSRLVLNYRFNDDVMAYFSASEGFKSGGFSSFISQDASGNPQIETAAPEEMTNLEVGLKSTLLEGRMQFNAAYFDYEYKNQQINDLIGEPIPVYRLRNADVDGKGYEITTTWLATDNLTLGANYSNVKTEYTKYEVKTLLGEDPILDDLTGEPADSVPENKYNIFTEFRTDAVDGEVFASAVYTWVDKRSQSAGTTGIRKIDSYDLVNARLGYKQGNWEVAAWGKNLTDTKTVWGVGGTGEAIGSANAERAPGRTWGVDLIMSF